MAPGQALNLPDLSTHRPVGFFSTQDRLEAALEELDLLSLSGVHSEGPDAPDEDALYRRVVIGHSKEGRKLWGLRIGCGTRHVSLTAGAHADEPIGPVTAVCLARALLSNPELSGLLDSHRFYICPQINPDGAERNRGWFQDPLEFTRYVQQVIRELPGDDIEFGYPRKAAFFSGEDDEEVSFPLEALRPENQAVANFLKVGAPYDFHCSLHGMGFSEGAWFLIGEDWADRALPLMERLEVRVDTAGIGWHDIDRDGDKGFRRLRRGFCTTPNHVAMRAHFLRQGDAQTASRFHPSSMEYVRSLGGDPLVMVSELPLFRIGVEWDGEGGSLRDTPYTRFRDALTLALRFGANSERGAEELRSLADDFQIKPLPLAIQIRLQGEMILEALDFLFKARTR